MGACSQVTLIPACSEQKLREKFADLQETLRIEHGNDTYAGHLGIADGLVIDKKAFKNTNDAYDYIIHHDVAKKWGPAVAVRIGDFNNMFPKSAADKKLMATYDAVSNELTTWSASLLARVKKAKSLFRGCKRCGSKVAVKYLTSLPCPICGDTEFIETATDLKRKASLRTKYRALQPAVYAAETKYKEKTKDIPVWYIAAWCAE